MNPTKYDFIIIGAGIIGSMIARELSKYNFMILIIEKENDIGMGPSSSNSAIIHSGHDPVPGTLKAEMNIRGNKLWTNLGNHLGISIKWTGSFVVAIGDEEYNEVKKLYERAIVNGVPGIEILKKNEILYREPKISSEVTGALWTPHSGVLDPFEAVVAVCESAVINKAELRLNTKFEDFIIEKNKIIGISTNNGKFYSKWVINCAGLYSDDVMHKARVRPEFKINPVRGEYFIFDASKVKLNTVLYPVPTDKGKGTLVSTTTHGNVMIGPNAQAVLNKESTETTRDGLSEIAKNAKRLVPEIDIKNVIASFAGLRAKGNYKEKDFIIEIPEKVSGFVNLGGIESPGFAAAPAIAMEVVRLLKDRGEQFVEKKEWISRREARPKIKSLSHKEREEIVKKNPLYGRIICRCEEITEGEILDAIHSLIPATTYDGIKKRTWLGTGRCQGAFDYPKVIEILSSELKIPMTEISKKGKGSEYLFRKTKDIK